MKLKRGLRLACADDTDLYWVASGFVFRKVDSGIHRLDPRVKLLIMVELFALSVLAFKIDHLLAVTVTSLLMAVAAKIMKRFLRTMVFTAVFSLIIFGINALVGYGVTESIVLALRFVSIVGSTSIFFLTTSPDELELVMKWLRFPQDVVFAFVTAIRFVPVLMIDTLQIMDAQKSRGLELEKGNFITRIRNMIPILIPLVVAAVIRSGELAEAMEARAYRAVKKPTSMLTAKLHLRDKIAIIASGPFFIISLYFYVSQISII